MYKRGCTNKMMVRQIQEILGITVDGIFGPKTEAAVIKFQMDNHLVADGIVGRKTLHAMGILDTDMKSNLIYKTSNNLIIQKHFLPEGEYIKDSEPIFNDYLFLHHTAGWDDPFKCIDYWARDNRGAVATEFVIGGQNIRNRNNTYDGRVAQSFPTGCQGWHLGATGSYYMNRHSVGIELCNFGQLNEEFKNYVNITAHDSQIVTLKEPFRGYKHWHRYSDKQLLALKKLILYVGERDNIDIHRGLIEWIKKEGPAKAFDFRQDAYEGKVKGMLLHCNVRKDKKDLFPQQELIDMLLSL